MNPAGATSAFPEPVLDLFELEDAVREAFERELGAEMVVDVVARKTFFGYTVLVGLAEDLAGTLEGMQAAALAGALESHYAGRGFAVQVTAGKTNASRRKPDGIDVEQFREEFARRWAEARQRREHSSAVEEQP